MYHWQGILAVDLIGKLYYQSIPAECGEGSKYHTISSSHILPISSLITIILHYV